MSIAVFLPTRKGSQRIKNKNTKVFSGYEGGLLELKLKQLCTLEVDEIILSSNDEDSIKIAEMLGKNFSNLKIVRRPDQLASSSTNLTDLIAYVPTITSCDHILWTHVTSPMVDAEVYSNSIRQFNESRTTGFDSLMSVNSFKNFLWDKERKDIINRVGDKRWPQTQDLQELYEINSAIFLAPRSLYLDKHDRVGDNPYLFKLNKLQSIDVDWEEDFKIAEVVYDKFYK